MGHRAVSKALKPVLVELAIRTTEKLERHEDDEEFLEVELQLNAALERRLETRLKVLENELHIMTEYYNQRLSQDEEYLQMQYKVCTKHCSLPDFTVVLIISKDRVAALQDDFVTRAENRILELGRQYEHELDDSATDDEVSNFCAIALPAADVVF
jgi:hypothetical protein